MKIKRVFLILSLLLLLPVVAAAQTKLLRHPSYHNGKIAFSYLGDIWVANEDGTGVQRLTVHRARDIYPRFSPDGKWIAFSSNRYGNYDVFVMPAQGGQPKQLTFHTGNDTVVGWTPDGKKIIFQASRNDGVFPGIPSLYEVPLDGGLEERIPTDWGYWGSYRPDGKRFAFNRHPMVWWRKHYRGSYAADLWVMDVATKKFVRLGDDDYKGNYFWPMYGQNGEIYFVADILPNEKNIKPGSPDVLKSVNNIWKISERGGKPVQITHHTSGSLFFPSISSDRRVIVYEENFGIWKLDLASGKTSEIKINITSDDKENYIETLTIQNEADSYDLSPTTRRAVISTHGELFTIATERGDVQRVTESYFRDRDPEWSPDGKWIAFVSDRSGRDEVWITDELGKTLKKLSDSDTEKIAIAWAPDSKSLIYSASDHKLYRVEIESGRTQVIAESEVSNIQNPQFSPDGQWISYTKLDRDLRPHVYVIPSTGGQERHIGNENTFSEAGAQWTPDGKKLIFLAGFVQGGSATVRQNVAQVYIVSLQKEERSPTERDIDTEEEAMAAERTGRPRVGPPTGGEPQRVEVKIDWDGLDRRIRQLTRLSDNITTAVPSPDSRLVAFVAVSTDDGRPTSSIYTIQEDGQRLTRITQIQPPSEGEDGPPPGFGGFGGGLRSLQFSRDGRTLYFMQGNGIYAVGVGGPGGGGDAQAQAPAPGGPAAGRPAERRRLTFTARVEVDHRAEWKQVFNESWRVMKNRFYDPNMHGVDWARVKSVYEPLMDYVGDQEEMHNVVSQMIGELNASHTGISGGQGPGDDDQPRIQTRYPGFEIVPDPSGYYRVSYIYKNGPADKDYVKIAVGDYILAIDDQPLKAGDNYWKYYNSVPGRKFEFTVNSKPTLEGAWKTKVEPVSGGAYTTLVYEKWVAERKALVDKLSQGEIGYLHIRQMNQPSLARFIRDLIENRFKKALIIDQRFNPGGGIDQELLQILQQRQYQYTRQRDSVVLTRPQRAFFGPMVVMQNERSTSDAEVFPDGFRTLGLGKIVGTTTYGAVIGTGSYRLMDGSQIRTPGTGLWNVKGYNLENYGVPPDVYVDNTPEDFLKGRDAQLEKAVEVLKEELKRTVVPEGSTGRSARRGA